MSIVVNNLGKGYPSFKKIIPAAEKLEKLAPDDRIDLTAGKGRKPEQGLEQGNN